MDVCRKNGIPEPKWICKNGMITVVFKRTNIVNDKADDIYLLLDFVSEVLFIGLDFVFNLSPHGFKHEVPAD
jgi:hypothetical protein